MELAKVDCSAVFRGRNTSSGSCRQKERKKGSIEAEFDLILSDDGRSITFQMRAIV